jgi:hypothetical protein
MSTSRIYECPSPPGAHACRPAARAEYAVCPQADAGFARKFWEVGLGGGVLGAYRKIDRQVQEMDFLINFGTDSKIFTRHTPL